MTVEIDKEDFKWLIETCDVYMNTIIEWNKEDWEKLFELRKKYDC